MGNKESEDMSKQDDIVNIITIHDGKYITIPMAKKDAVDMAREIIKAHG